MNLKEGIAERRSIRGYLDTPVSKELLKEVITLASRAVSAVNAQPWKFHIVTGEPLAAIRKENLNCIEQGCPEEFEDAAVDGIYKTRRIEIAKQLYGAMEIAREDKERRTWWNNRGVNFFDAPAGIIITRDKILGMSYNFDVGCVAQNLCLAAMAHGLGTCVAYQPLTYLHVLREVLGIPEDEEFVCGVAIGYPDPAFAANHVRSNRESVDKTACWYGFED